MTQHEEATQIQKFLEITVRDNPSEIQERISSLMVFHARTGFMLAEAKKTLSAKKKTEIINTVIEIAKTGHLSAKAQNALVDSIALEEQYMVDWLDRLNATCKHQLDACRSLLSYEKEVYRQNNIGGQT